MNFDLLILTHVFFLPRAASDRTAYLLSPFHLSDAYIWLLLQRHIPPWVVTFTSGTRRVNTSAPKQLPRQLPSIFHKYLQIWSNFPKCACSTLHAAETLS